MGAVRQGNAPFGPPGREQHFARGKARQFFQNAHRGVTITTKLRRCELSRGNINVRQPNPYPRIAVAGGFRGEGQQIAVLALFEHTWLDDRSTTDDLAAAYRRTREGNKAGVALLAE